MRAPQGALMAEMMKRGASAPPMASASPPPAPETTAPETLPPLMVSVKDHPELKNVQPGDDVTLEVHATVDAVSPDGELQMTMNDLVAQAPATPTPNEAFTRASTRAMSATPEPIPQGA